MARIDSEKGDVAMVAALAGGASNTAAARAAGKSERTVCRRLEDPEFRRRIAEARDQLFQLALGRLANASTEAVETLRRLLARNDTPTAQLGAARAILEHGPKLREATEYEARISAMEAKVDEVC